MDKSDKELCRALREQFELLLQCEPARTVEAGPACDGEAIALAETLNRFIDRFNEARDFILALASGDLEATPPHRNMLASPFQQLHAELRRNSGKGVEEVLRHQEMMLKEAEEIAHVGGWEFDPVTLKGSWTEETARIHDIEPGQDIDAADGLAFYEGESRARIEAAVAKAMASGAPYDLELELVSAKGVRKWVRTICHPIVSEGRVIRVRGSIQDITGRRIMEDALRASEGRYRSLFDNMLEGFAYCKMLFEDGKPADFIYLLVNPSFERLTGLKNVVGKRVTEVIPGIREADSELFDIYAGVSLTGRPERFEMFVDALQMWFSISVYCPEKEFFVAVFDVISERKRAEKALRESESMLQRAEAMAHLGHWRVDLDSHGVTWSDEVYRILGVSRETFRPERGWHQELIHPDDLESMSGLRESLLLEGSGEFEFRIVRPDGELRHVAGYAEIMRDEKGRAETMFGTVLDTTELRRKERELQERNAEMERFTYLISHDLKSPLVTVKTYLGFLEKDLLVRDTERVGKDIFHMRSATDKMGRLLDELLEMLRVGRLINPPEQVSFRELAAEALEMVAGRISECNVEARVSGEPVNLCGDRPRLAEIWQNLVENAVKFMGDQPSPRIELGVENCGGETVFFVRDNGIGIDPRYRTKVFGLFEKLDPQADGTGLGLALVKRIVEHYRGTVWVESEGAGHGACFRFTLPGALAHNVKGEEHDR